jgi:hypothetical protein
VLNHLYPTSATGAKVQADLAYLAAIIAAIQHHVKPGDGLAFRAAAETSFLALSKAQQRQAAEVQTVLLRMLLSGQTVKSWLTAVFRNQSG